jgi:hypothetical protein
MKGREALTMDGKTRVTWVLRPSQNTRRTRPQRVPGGIPEHTDALRAKLIAATVEVATEVSNPRLGQSRYAQMVP